MAFRNVGKRGRYRIVENPVTGEFKLQQKSFWLWFDVYNVTSKCKEYVEELLAHNLKEDASKKKSNWRPV